MALTAPAVLTVEQRHVQIAERFLGVTITYDTSHHKRNVELLAEVIAAAEQRGLDLGRADAWIPVGERLPERKEEPVLVYHPAWGVREGWLSQAGGVLGMWAGDVLATHWKPMPAPPRSGQ